MTHDADTTRRRPPKPRTATAGIACAARSAATLNPHCLLCAEHVTLFGDCRGQDVFHGPGCACGTPRPRCWSEPPAANGNCDPVTGAIIEDDCGDVPRWALRPHKPQLAGSTPAPAMEAKR